MKTTDIKREINIIKVIIPLMVLTLFTSTSIFSQSAKKLKTRMSFDYFNNSADSRTLNASIFVVEAGKRLPIVNEYIYFYLGDISEDNLLDSIRTDENGLAKHIFNKQYKFPFDDERKVSYSAQFNGNKTFNGKSAEIDIKVIDMELFLSEIDSVKTICVRAYEKGNNEELFPIQDTEISFYVPRLFSDQLIGKGEFTDGKSQIGFPEDIAGDTIGNISIIARIEDHDFYGNVERRVTNFRWGTNTPIKEDQSLMTIQITLPTRALWHTNAPLWMIITLIILLTGVWGHYVYVIINLIKLKRLSKNKNPDSEADQLPEIVDLEHAKL
jgi:hypothetical protein